MVLRRRILIAFPGLLGVAGCLGEAETDPNNETEATADSSPVRESEEPTETESDVLDDPPEWLDKYGGVDYEALSAAHSEVVWSDDDTWNRIHSTIDAPEPTGHEQVFDHDLVLEVQGTDGIRYDYRDDEGPKGAGVRFPFSDALYHEAENHVRYGKTSFYEMLLADEAVFRHELRAEELRYRGKIDYGGELAYQLAGGNVEAIVDTDDVIRRISGEMTVASSDKEVDVTFERTVERDADPELPDWIQRVPWLNLKPLESGVYELAHMGGADIGPETWLRIGYDLDGNWEEEHVVVQEQFERNESRYIVFVEDTDGVVPELRREKPTDATEDVGRIALDHQRDGYTITVLADPP